MRKELLLGIVFVVSILVVGCTKNELPLLSPTEERAIIEPWSGLVGWHEGDPNRVEEFMSLLKNEWKLNVLKLYKGELIFRGHGYNYLFVPELAAKERYNDFSPETNLMFEGMGKEERLNFFIGHIRKSNGSLVCITPGNCPGDGQAATFDSIKDIEKFLDWWSTL